MPTAIKRLYLLISAAFLLTADVLLPANTWLSLGLVLGFRARA
jgi:hypothetical protein